MTAEQKARDLLERMEVPNAQSFSAGELVELANLIAEADGLRSDAKRYRTLRDLYGRQGWLDFGGWDSPSLDAIVDEIAARQAT